ncbi:MAG: hypothetical protein RCG15_02370 [Candidatus Rickettsia vulgarisii]
MLRHLSPEQKWEILFKAILPNSKITVTNISDNMIYLSTDQGTIEHLQSLLANPNELKLNITHAISTNNIAKTVSIKSESDTSKILSYFSKQPEDLLLKLIASEYITETLGLKDGYNLSNFSYNDITKIAKLHFEGKKATITLVEAKYNLFSSSLPDAKTALEILQGKTNPINDELSNSPNGIIKIQSNNTEPPSIDILYNYGYYIQAVQASEEQLIPSEPPIIALPNVDTIQEWTINQNVIVNFLGSIFNNVLFSPIQENEKELQPVIFSPKELMSISKPHSLHAIFDTSSSMESGFTNYLINT